MIFKSFGLVTSRTLSQDIYNSFSILFITKIEILDKASWTRKTEPSGKKAVSVGLNPKFQKDTFKLPKGMEIIGVASRL
jgi:hypothetical protein